MRPHLLLFALLLALSEAAFAQSGFVKSGGQAIPGATVAATQGSKTFSTVTDADGHYAFPPLGTGAWTVTVEMFGFDTQKKDVDYAGAKGPVNFDLALKPSPLLRRLEQFQARRNAAPNSAGAGPGGPAGAQRGVNAARNGQQVDQALENELNSEQQSAAAPAPGSEAGNEAFLVSGSLSPGMREGNQADSGPDM